MATHLSLLNINDASNVKSNMLSFLNNSGNGFANIDAFVNRINNMTYEEQTIVKLGVADSLHDWTKGRGVYYDSYTFNEEILKEVLNVGKLNFDTLKYFKNKLFGKEFERSTAHSSYELRYEASFENEHAMQPGYEVIYLEEIIQFVGATGGDIVSNIKERVRGSNGSIKIMSKYKKSIDDFIVKDKNEPIIETTKLKIAKFISWYLHGDITRSPNNETIKFVFDVRPATVGHIYRVPKSGGTVYYPMECTADSANTMSDIKLDGTAPELITFSRNDDVVVESNFLTCDKIKMTYRAGSKWGGKEENTKDLQLIVKNITNNKEKIYQFGLNSSAGAGVPYLGALMYHNVNKQINEELPMAPTQIIPFGEEPFLDNICNNDKKLFYRLILDYKRSGDYQQVMAVLRAIKSGDINLSNCTFCSGDIMAVLFARYLEVAAIRQYSDYLFLYRNDRHKPNISEEQKLAYEKNQLEKQQARKEEARNRDKEDTNPIEVYRIDEKDITFVKDNIEGVEKEIQQLLSSPNLVSLQELVALSKVQHPVGKKRALETDINTEYQAQKKNVVGKKSVLKEYLKLFDRLIIRYKLLELRKRIPSENKMVIDNDSGNVSKEENYNANEFNHDMSIFFPEKVVKYKEGDINEIYKRYKEVIERRDKYNDDCRDMIEGMNRGEKAVARQKSGKLAIVKKSFDNYNKIYCDKIQEFIEYPYKFQEFIEYPYAVGGNVINDEYAILTRSVLKELRNSCDVPTSKSCPDNQNSKSGGNANDVSHRNEQPIITERSDYTLSKNSNKLPITISNDASAKHPILNVQGYKSKTRRKNKMCGKNKTLGKNKLYCKRYTPMSNLRGYTPFSLKSGRQVGVLSEKRSNTRTFTKKALQIRPRKNRTLKKHKRIHNQIGGNPTELQRMVSDTLLNLTLDIYRKCNSFMTDIINDFGEIPPTTTYIQLITAMSSESYKNKHHFDNFRKEIISYIDLELSDIVNLIADVSDDDTKGINKRPPLGYTKDDVVREILGYSEFKTILMFLSSNINDDSNSYVDMNELFLIFDGIADTITPTNSPQSTLSSISSFSIFTDIQDRATKNAPKLDLFVIGLSILCHLEQYYYNINNQLKMLTSFGKKLVENNGLIERTNFDSPHIYLSTTLLQHFASIYGAIRIKMGWN